MTDPSNPLIRPQDMSHAMLVAVLMAHGGSLTLPPGSFEREAPEGLDGSWHAVAMEPQRDGTVRLSVRPRPDVDGPGIHVQ